MEENNIPRLTGEEKINYIIGLNLIKAQIDALKNLLTEDQKDSFNDTIEWHKQKFLSSPQGIEKEIAIKKSGDFDKVKLKKTIF